MKKAYGSNQAAKDLKKTTAIIKPHSLYFKGTKIKKLALHISKIYTAVIWRPVISVCLIFYFKTHLFSILPK